MTKLMNNRTALRLAAVSSAMIVLGAASPAFAQTATDNLGVSATVTGNCTLTTTPVAFGNIDATAGGNTDAAGAIAVTCTSGTTWAASADAGTGPDATLAVRQLSNGAAVPLNYALYTQAGRTTLWGDGTGGTATIAGTGTGAAQDTPIYARVPGGQTGTIAGVYNDTVVVTVTYP